MPNPFKLTGPEFLVVYAVLGVTVLAGLHLLRRFAESGSVPRIDYSDPYLLAYLRGGELETMRVTVVSLIDRGLLHLSGGYLTLTNDKAIELVRRPVEAAVLRRAQAASSLSGFFDSRTIRATTVEYREKLEQLGLLPNNDIIRLRTFLLCLGLAILLGIALSSIVAAALRGRHNVLFLIVLAGIFSYLAKRYYNPFRTARGDVLLADTQTLFQALKNRASMIVPGGATGEAALLMAVFGIAALPGTKFPAAREIEERRPSSTLSGGGCGSAGCGHSCSSCSSGSSCGGGGSGCGGGGGCGGGS